MSKTPLFKIGDYVKIKDSGARSSAATRNPSLITTIREICYFDQSHNGSNYYYRLNIPGMGGDVWPSEIEPSLFESDEDYEYV